MKRIIYLLLFISLLILPVIVYGEDCNPGSISITGIELNSISGKAKEVSSPTVDNNKINLDLNLNEVGDIVEYNLYIHNSSNEDFFFEEDLLNNISNYVDYTLEYDSNKVESNSDKTIILKIEYKREVPKAEVGNFILDDTKVLSLDLNTKEDINVIDTNQEEIEVPNTSIDMKYSILVIFILLVILIVFYKTNNKNIISIILIGFILLPVITNAICKSSIEINSNIKIKRPVPVTETIYWALQDNDSNSINETLIISSEEVDGVLKGNISGDSIFTSYSEVPWIIGNYSTSNNLSKDVNNVNINNLVVPTSTAYWFSGVGYNASTFEANLSNLITNSITNMSYMFNYTGYNATTWDIGDIGSWDTGKVTNMYSMFRYTGYNASTWDIGDISNWNTSNVTNMSYMFYYSGFNATTWSIGNLSNWDTSKVTNMSIMFSSAGYYSTTLELDLSRWNTSNVTNMYSMFNHTGYNTTNFNLDISNWDTGNVTDMSYMFKGAGFNSTSFNLNLSNWNTSNVTNMSSMFNNTGKNATSWQVTIPKTNGNSINNSTSRMYGNSTSKYATPISGKLFTLAN